MYQGLMELPEHDFGEFNVLAENVETPQLSYITDIDWLDLVRKANEIQKVSPTISFKNDKEGLLAWVSAYGENDDLNFIVYFEYPVMVKKWFGLVKSPGEICVQKDGLNISQVQEVMALFFADKFEEASSYLSGLKQMIS